MHFFTVRTVCWYGLSELPRLDWLELPWKGAQLLKYFFIYFMRSIFFYLFGWICGSIFIL